MVKSILQPLEIRSVQDAVTASEVASDRSSWIDNSWASPTDLHTFRHGVWFRGVSNEKEFRLEPSVMRPTAHGNPPETSLTLDYLSRVAETDGRSMHFDSLARMQHNGLPTRLLDWSESMLVALYFAAEAHAERDGAVFALLAARLNGNATISRAGGGRLMDSATMEVVIRAAMSRHDTWSSALQSTDVVPMDRVMNLEVPGGGHQRLRPFELALDSLDPGSACSPGQRELAVRIMQGTARPVAVVPRRSSARLVAQHGMFTIHGGKRYPGPVAGGPPAPERLPDPVGLEELAESALGAGEPLLMKWVVPAIDKGRLLMTLDKLGIHRGSLFPEADQQARYVRSKWVV